MCPVTGIAGFKRDDILPWRQTNKNASASSENRKEITSSILLSQQNVHKSAFDVRSNFY